MHLEIPMPDGNICDCELIQKDGPGVLQLTDIGGIREANIQTAQQLADEGYTVLMPNIFYRESRPPLESLRTLDREAMMARMAARTAPLTPEAIASDSAAYLDVLAKHSRPGPLAVVGYCYSGGVALRIAAAHPDKIAAAVSFHGANLYLEGNSNSPHLVLPQVKARLYFGHAVKDTWMPEAAIEAFNKALEAWGGQYESEVYEGAFHSWTTPDSPVYNPDQAARAFSKLTALLGRS